MTLSRRIHQLNDHCRTVLHDCLHQDYRVRDTMTSVVMECDCAEHMQIEIESGRLKMETERADRPRRKD